MNIQYQISNIKYQIIFLLIFFIAAFLRVYKLDQYPPSLNWDEISLGYNAYSILETGRDEWGQKFPFSFRAYGDYKLPVYVYVDTIFIKIFGLNSWGVRLPSALLGIGVVVFIFLILKNLSNYFTALSGMFLAAISPWPIILSRIALEANLALFLTAGSFYFYILGLKKNHYLIFSALLLGFSLFSYNSSRVIVVPLVLLSLLLFFKKINLYKNFLALAILIFFFIGALPLAVLQDSSARYKWTTILDEGAISKINELRGSAALPALVDKLVYNKVTYFIPQAVRNYISHFGPGFLFINGGSNYQYSIPGSGLLYLCTLPLFFIGLYGIYLRKQKWQFLVLGWLLIAPIPASITRDAPHALRSLMMIPPFLIITVLGLDLIYQRIKVISKFILAGFILISTLQLVQFWQNYTGDYIKNFSWSWQYGYREAVDFIKLNYGNYSKIYFTKKYGEPHEFVLFYFGYNPGMYQSNPNLIRYHRSDWYWVDGFDKFVFVNDWEIKNVKCQISNFKCLMVTSPGNYPEGGNVIKTINFLDDKRAFDIVEI